MGIKPKGKRNPNENRRSASRAGDGYHIIRGSGHIPLLYEPSYHRVLAASECLDLRVGMGGQHEATTLGCLGLLGFEPVTEDPDFLQDGGDRAEVSDGFKDPNYCLVRMLLSEMTGRVPKPLTFT